MDNAAGAGRLRLTGVRPDRYLVTPSVPQGFIPISLTLNGREILDVPVDVGAEGVSGFVLTISERRTLLAGSVTTPDGRPLGGAAVGVFPAAAADRQPFGERRLRLRRATADANGQFRFPDLPPGNYIAVAMSVEEVDAWPDPKILDVLAARGRPIVLSPGDTQETTLRLESR
jgi:hypothetical protein